MADAIDAAVLLPSERFFSTPEDRARVKVGESIPVRYDSEDHRRVVVDTEKGPGE